MLRCTRNELYRRETSTRTREITEQVESQGNKPVVIIFLSKINSINYFTFTMVDK